MASTNHRSTQFYTGWTITIKVGTTGRDRGETLRTSNIRPFWGVTTIWSYGNSQSILIQKESSRVEMPADQPIIVDGGSIPIGDLTVPKHTKENKRMEVGRPWHDTTQSTPTCHCITSSDIKTPPDQLLNYHWKLK